MLYNYTYALCNLFSTLKFIKKWYTTFNYVNKNTYLFCILKMHLYTYSQFQQTQKKLAASLFSKLPKTVVLYCIF